MANKKLTQGEVVLAHLRQKNRITSIEAIGLYGITRLSAVVHALCKKKYDIRSELKQGVNAQYATYRLYK